MCIIIYYSNFSFSLSFTRLKKNNKKKKNETGKNNRLNDKNKFYLSVFRADVCECVLACAGYLC